MFAHLKHPFADRLNIAQVAELSFPQPLDETLPCQAVLQALEPVGELIETFCHIDHGLIVIVRLHNINLQRSSKNMVFPTQEAIGQKNGEQCWVAQVTENIAHDAYRRKIRRFWLSPMFGLQYREEGAEAGLVGAPLRRDRAIPLLFYPQHRRDRFIDYGAEPFRRGFNSAFNQIGVQVTDCLNNLDELQNNFHLIVHIGALTQRGSAKVFGNWEMPGLSGVLYRRAFGGIEKNRRPNQATLSIVFFGEEFVFHGGAISTHWR